MAPHFWDYRLRLHSYTFYERRPQFVRTLTAFGNWVLIAAESGAFDYDTGSERGGERSGERGHAAPGDLVFAAPHLPLWRSATVTPLTYHVLQWSFENAPAGALWQPGKWTVPDTARLFEDYALLRTYYGRSDDWTRRRMENILEELLLMAHAARYAAHDATPAISDPTMRQAARMLRERAADVFSMTEISAAVNLKPVQFTRRFRKAHGITPIEYLTRVRLETARRLLIETDASLDEIAEKCGWSSGYYLSSVFKSAFGMAPGQFRRLHRV